MNPEQPSSTACAPPRCALPLYMSEGKAGAWLPLPSPPLQICHPPGTEEGESRGCHRGTARPARGTPSPSPPHSALHSQLCRCPWGPVNTVFFPSVTGASQPCEREIGERKEVCACVCGVCGVCMCIACGMYVVCVVCVFIVCVCSVWRACVHVHGMHAGVHQP